MMLITRFLIAALCLALSLSFSGNVYSGRTSQKDTNWRQRASNTGSTEFARTVDQSGKLRTSAFTPLRRLSSTKRKLKPLTPKQLKAKEKYTLPPRPYVFREHKFKFRLPLANLTVGQQMTGKIIAITSYGLFVDVGSVKDGLVHIKDASGAYFLEKSQLDRMFTPGQHVDVWVKFVEPLAQKIGLQMYPLRSSQEDFDILDLKIGSEITGKAVKYSEYGVFLDIGAGGDLAFLPKRKIKINHRMFRWQPWEIIPLGTEVNCLVHEIDAKRRRLSLTTYEVHEWDDKLPLPLKDREKDPNEEKLGIAEATRIRLRREYANVTFEDVVGEDFEDPDSGMQRTKDKGGVRGGNVVVMDDFAEEEEEEEKFEGGSRSVAMSAALGKPVEGRPFNRLEKNLGLPSAVPEFDISTEEIWDSISGGLGFVTLSKLMKWNKLHFYLHSEMIDLTIVESIMRNAGAINGRLFKSEFETFLELLTDALNLKDREGPEAQQWENEMPYRQIPNNPQWEEVVWQHLTQSKRERARLSFTDVLQWPAISSHLELLMLTMISVERIFHKTASVADGLIGRAEFSQLVLLLNRHVTRVYMDQYRDNYLVTDQDDPSYEETDALGKLYADVSEAGAEPVEEEDVSENPVLDGAEEDQEEGESSLWMQSEGEQESEVDDGDNDEDEEVEEEEGEEKLYEPFHVLANNKTFVSLKNLKKWEMVQEMTEKKIVDEVKLKEILDRLTTNRKLQYEHWPAFVYELALLNEKYEQAVLEEEKRLAPSSVDSEGAHDVNVDADFRKLSGGLATIRYEELMQYPLIESLLRQRKIEQAVLRRLVVNLARKARAVRRNEIQKDAIKNMHIDVNLFNSILVEIVSLTETTEV